MHSFEQECPIKAQENRKNRMVLAFLQLFAKKVIIFLLKSCKYVHQLHIMKNQCIQFWGVKYSIDIQNVFNWYSIKGGKVFNWYSILGGKVFKSVNNFSRLYKYPLSENRALQGLYERIRVLNLARFCLVSDFDIKYQDFFCKKRAQKSVCEFVFI
jgi:hypothetical protein